MEQDKIFIDIDNLPKKLSSSETQELFIKMKNGDIKAKEKLATHNIGIVLYEVIKKFRYTKYDPKELVSVGNVGLMKAINTYDITQNACFFTYAQKCIDNEILYFLRENKKNSSNFSLEYVLTESDEGNDLTLKDVITSTDKTTEEEYENDEVKNIVREIVEKLPPRKSKIIMLRYGFYNDEIYTQEEIGRCLNISQSNVSKIIDVTLDEISKELYKRDIISKPRNKSKYKFSSERGEKVKVKKN